MSKLVRDRVPEIIRAAGQDPIIRRAGQSEHRSRLRDKLLEEAAEVAAAPFADLREELADVMEVVYALAENTGSSPADIERVRKAKRETHGGFNKGLIWDGNR